jgi:hypothetical protein
MMIASRSSLLSGIRPAPGWRARPGAFGATFWWCLGLTVLALAPALLLAGRARRRPPATSGT